MTDEESQRLRILATASRGQRRDSRQIMAAEVLRLSDEVCVLANDLREFRQCLEKLIQELCPEHKQEE